MLPTQGNQGIQRQQFRSPTPQTMTQQQFQGLTTRTRGVGLQHGSLGNQHDQQGIMTRTRQRGLPPMPQHTPQLLGHNQNGPQLQLSTTTTTTQQDIDIEDSHEESQQSFDPPPFRFSSIGDNSGPPPFRFSMSVESQHGTPVHRNSDIDVDYDDMGTHEDVQLESNMEMSNDRKITDKWPEHELKQFTKIFGGSPMDVFKELNKELKIDPKDFDKVTFTPMGNHYQFDVEKAGVFENLNVKFYPKTQDMVLQLAKLDKKSQGGDTMKKAFKGMFKAMDKSPLDWKMNMKANLTVGGYAWPRYGFKPTEKAFPDLAENVAERLDDLENLIGMLESNELKVPDQPDKKQLTKIKKELNKWKKNLLHERDQKKPNTKMIRDLAGLTTNLDFLIKMDKDTLDELGLDWIKSVQDTAGKREVTLGKAALLGQDYNAVFDKKDRRIMQTYVLGQKAKSFVTNFFKTKE